jgi:hypothetical protein
VNGETFQCVAYTENSTGRSGPSPASASFTPCGGVFDCYPWAKWVVSGLVLAALLGAVLLVARRYARRNRVWITAQVDGGADRPLGWGPQLGVGLDHDDGGWYAAERPLNRAPIRIRYLGKNRFMVHSAAGARDVHQGDQASVREGTDETHQLILRRHGRPPREAPPRPSPPDAASVSALGARLDGSDED